MKRREGVFSYEYPCHSPTEQRSFTMSLTPLEWSGLPCFTISHRDITKRKLAEDQVRSVSLLDGLTGVANRRRFDQFLNHERRRETRAQMAMSLILLDDR